ncbi:hypothetical protein CORC01_06994 [Colletotrichum orchidophilum]|uniref:Uncharacterized protein n=1 Tax=Colletotrichum orchidophilum TaxID=1209926 RepID=A0A1G4B8M0_9PEZI|nr:uncharacterized protein CORC01_06994 [Colletotrichum orchidophilum]OHE97789.1 hypothetical protein CORC01_06994 [Colletotrichum orchidophilum]
MVLETGYVGTGGLGGLASMSLPSIPVVWLEEGRRRFDTSAGTVEMGYGNEEKGEDEGEDEEERSERCRAVRSSSTVEVLSAFLKPPFLHHHDHSHQS